MDSFFSDHALLVFLVLAAGWLLALLLVVFLLVLTSKWKAAFKERDWTLMPTMDGAAMLRAAEASAVQTQRLEDVVRATAEYARETREEFAILGRDLDAKSEEIRSLRMGFEFHHRRALVLTMIRSLEAIAIDQAAGTSPDTTIRGIAVELEEALEENHVSVYEPAVGTRVPTRGVDVAGSRRTPTSDPELVGTIASVERPAYIATGPGGVEDVLRPAAVTVYVPEEGEQ